MNVYFQEETYSKIKNLIAKREISRFINEAVEEKLQQKQQREKEELKERLIIAYKRIASNKNLQNELAIWDETVDDVLVKENERKK